jgi:peptide/nickel transport system substrate-binding protein
MVGDLLNLEGHQIGSTSVNTTFQVFDRLIEYDPSMTPMPMLAESWEQSTDLKQLKLNLRKGVQFHTGREFTSEDVKYNFMRVRDPKIAPLVGQLAAQSNWWTSIETPDKYTVVLASEKSRPGAFDFLQYLNMVDRDTVEGPNGQTRAVGTGPFSFVEWVQGDHITYAKNKNYWRTGQPYLDQVVVSVLKDPQSMVLQLETGALDLIDSPPITDAVRMTSDGKFPLLKNINGGQFFYVTVNTTAPPFDNKQVRQAVNYAVNRPYWTDSILKGLVGPPQDLPWPPQAGAADPAKNNVYTYDLDKARSLLTAAGVSNLQVDLIYSTTGSVAEFATLAQLLQSDLAKIGIGTTIKPLELSQLIDSVNKYTYGILLFQGTYAQLAESSSEFTIGRTFNHTFNNAGFKSDEWSQQVIAAGTEPNTATRKGLYSQLNDYILDQSFVMPISLYPSMAAMRPSVKGLRYNQLNGLVWADTWLE